MNRRIDFRRQVERSELSTNGILRVREKRYVVIKNSGIYPMMRNMRSSLPVTGDELDYDRIRQINEYEDTISRSFGTLGLKKQRNVGLTTDVAKVATEKFIDRIMDATSIPPARSKLVRKVPMRHQVIDEYNFLWDYFIVNGEVFYQYRASLMSEKI